jgi:hypothetical protein
MYSLRKSWNQVKARGRAVVTDRRSGQQPSNR